MLVFFRFDVLIVSSTSSISIGAFLFDYKSSFLIESLTSSTAAGMMTLMIVLNRPISSPRCVFSNLIKIRATFNFPSKLVSCSFPVAYFGHPLFIVEESTSLSRPIDFQLISSVISASFHPTVSVSCTLNSIFLSNEGEFPHFKFFMILNSKISVIPKILNLSVSYIDLPSDLPKFFTVSIIDMNSQIIHPSIFAHQNCTSAFDIESSGCTFEGPLTTFITRMGGDWNCDF